MGDLVRGPWPEQPADPPAHRLNFQWLSKRATASFTEDRRRQILAAKPRCRACGILFDPRAEVPKDQLCRPCREPPDDGQESLF